MKIYNKRGFILGIFWTGLAVWSIFHNFRSPVPNSLVQLRDGVFAVVLLCVGITSFCRAFSQTASREDKIEENDERNRLIEYKSKSKTLEIAEGVLFALTICGMVGFKLTANMVWFALFIIPGFLFGLFLIIEIFVKLYYERRG